MSRLRSWISPNMFRRDELRLSRLEVLLEEPRDPRLLDSDREERGDSEIEDRECVPIDRCRAKTRDPDGRSGTTSSFTVPLGAEVARALPVPLAPAIGGGETVRCKASEKTDGASFRAVADAVEPAVAADDADPAAGAFAGRRVVATGILETDALVLAGALTSGEPASPPTRTGILLPRPTAGGGTDASEAPRPALLGLLSIDFKTNNSPAYFPIASIRHGSTRHRRCRNRNSEGRGWSSDRR